MSFKYSLENLRKITHSGENGSSAYNCTLGFDESELKNIESDSVN